MPRPGGLGDPVIVPGNPVKLSRTAEGPETCVPWLGEHTDAVHTTALGLTSGERASLPASGVIA